ncbi:glyoxylase-like metal-dependent hydrolase (beta-lactamase superfamily II) [Arthrobacter ulcerisalmonis]|nr:MBL fold metallo-hydrolase [Arthrobacter ulcerisalmonis]MDQ0662768.1 glyoxylase-like metal-dependent hydrolase (beta-lactamase superfamily II) [Arthrobacter ulcerisalmonis]
MERENGDGPDGNGSWMMRVTEPQEIASGVMLMTSGSGPMASNLYLVRSGPAWVMVDCGWAGSAEPVRRAVEKVLGSGNMPAAIFLTHIHPDHSGAAGALARLWEIPVYVHQAELPMAAGRYIPEFSMPLDRWFIAPALWALPARARRRIETAGDITDVVQGLPRDGKVPGLADWVAVPTPGHTAGHVAYWRSGDGVLITGDAVVTVNLNSIRGFLPGGPDLCGPPWYTTWNWKLAMDSAARLAELGPRLLAPGHGPPLAMGLVPRLRAMATRQHTQRITLRRRIAGAPGPV